MARGDGIESVAEDGTVYFTEAARAAAVGLDPRLGEPLALDTAADRFTLLAAHLGL